MVDSFFNYLGINPLIISINELHRLLAHWNLTLNAYFSCFNMFFSLFLTILQRFLTPLDINFILFPKLMSLETKIYLNSL